MLRRLFGLTLLIGLLAATPAAAGLLPVSVSVNPEGDKFRWTYAIVLPTDSQLRSGDYFTIYDFGGYVPDSIVVPSSDWTVQTALKGPNTPGLDPLDDPAITNLTFQYGGPTITTGQLGLGNFWALSDFQLGTDSFFTARTHRTSDGRVDANITEATVPVPVAPPGVPEPTTLALAGIGLPMLAAARRMRK
ncbi:MAG TPA: PEP-CTERM sorting domain-containing protein [Gemmataceae bacterium]|nr:PEP-CTERM sorting domain-containing protein [Gemmataceae bacterium]